MNSSYNPIIRIIEQGYSGPFQSFLELNRPFLSDEIVSLLTRNLAQFGRAEFDAGSGVTFHFEVV